ncbi:hypothetical protein [Enterobacter soli]|uniref:hypothetical protein n=1 Tax=Enterobacter soli TaxID=885040 RepID=UPI001C251739
MSEPSIVPYVKTTPKPFGVDVEWKWPGGCAVLELQCLHEDGRLMKERIFWPATVCLISGLKAGERLQVRLRPIAEDGSARDWRAGDWIEGVSSVDVGEIVEALDEEIRNSDAFNIPSDKPFINDAAIKDGSISAKLAFPKSDLRLMEPFGGVPLRITNVSTKVSLTNEMRDAVIAAVRDSGQFVEKPTGDVQQSVVFMADRFKVTYGASASGEPTTQEKIQQGANAIIEAAKASLARHEAMMADLASAQTAITKSINQAVDDAIANALRPGGAIHRMLHR